MISISNIAWDTELDEAVSEVLIRTGVEFIDIAPPKYFKQPSKATETEVRLVKDYWIKKSIKPIGMQSLLFGTQGLNVFGGADVQRKLLEHLESICCIGSGLGAKKLVFGSPKNRDRSGLSDLEAVEIAVDFFGRLGDIAKEKDVVICLEPNPTCYRSNFMVDSEETANIVQAINHENVRMQLDIGAMCINKEDPDQIINRVSHLIHHIHISEPQLAPLNINNSYHLGAAAAIRKYLPNMPVTIEMLTTDSVSALEEIESSIQLVKTIYQGF